MTKNEASIICEELVESDSSTATAAAGDSLLFYLVGCGIVWRGDRREDAFRELVTAVHHLDPVVRCVATQMLYFEHAVGSL